MLFWERNQGLKRVKCWEHLPLLLLGDNLSAYCSWANVHWHRYTCQSGWSKAHEDSTLHKELGNWGKLGGDVVPREEHANWFSSAHGQSWKHTDNNIWTKWVIFSNIYIHACNSKPWIWRRVRKGIGKVWERKRKEINSIKISKNPCYSRGLRSNSEDPHGASQWSVTPARIQSPIMTSSCTGHTSGAQSIIHTSKTSPFIN